MQWIFRCILLQENFNPDTGKGATFMVIVAALSTTMYSHSLFWTKHPCYLDIFEFTFNSYINNNLTKYEEKLLLFFLFLKASSSQGTPHILFFLNNSRINHTPSLQKETIITNKNGLHNSLIHIARQRKTKKRKPHKLPKTRYYNGNSTKRKKNTTSEELLYEGRLVIPY